MWASRLLGSEARIWLDGSCGWLIHLSDDCGAVADPSYARAVAALLDDSWVILVTDDFGESIFVHRLVVRDAVARLEQISG